MRVVLDLDERAGEYFVVVSASGGPLSERSVRWTAGRRLLVAKDEPIGDDEASELASSVDGGSATAAELDRYGRLLFDAALGAQTWQRIVADAASASYLELAIRGRADQEQAATSAMQAVRWEALHDGTAPVAAKGTAVGSGR